MSKKTSENNEKIIYVFNGIYMWILRFIFDSIFDSTAKETAFGLAYQIYV